MLGVGLRYRFLSPLFRSLLGRALLSPLRVKVPLLVDPFVGVRAEVVALRLQKVTGQLDNPAKIGDVRRDLARVLTVLREKA